MSVKPAAGQSADFAPYGFSCSFRCLAEQLLELGEHLLDRVQVGRVWRQVEELGLGGADRLTDDGTFVAGQVVHDHDVARSQCRHEELLDPFGKAGPVDRLIEYLRRMSRGWCDLRFWRPRWSRQLCGVGSGGRLMVRHCWQLMRYRDRGMSRRGGSCRGESSQDGLASSAASVADIAVVHSKKRVLHSLP